MRKKGNNVLRILHSNPYGKDVYYPLCERGRLLTRLGKQEWRTDTFRQGDMDILKKLGFEIELLEGTLSPKDLFENPPKE